jgi:hypothetical protein
MATPEIYTVLSGVGHFLLQKSRPPYETIEDAVLVEVRAGETFVVPPDYGHLQINPTPEPLVFSYAVMGGMQGCYDPFKARRGAIYYELADPHESFVFNPRYGAQLPLRRLRAADLRQLPELNDGVTYQAIRDRLGALPFLTDPTAFPESAGLFAGARDEGPARLLRFDETATHEAHEGRKIAKPTTQVHKQETSK